MEETKIKSIVFSYKSLLNNVPAENRTADFLNTITSAFHKTLEKLLPTKYFAIYWEGDFWEIDIFNSVKALRTWEKNTKCIIDEWDGENFAGEKISYSVITFADFLEFSNGKYSDLNCYRSGLDYNDPIAFSPFFVKA